ncbi:recombinase family protein [Poseidonocella sedimentorum]|uniref:recombinase family protein n=1 Tax=Poseidonocella sedimentorum TaxID=871652 RepID=UPI0015A71430
MTNYVRLARTLRDLLGIVETIKERGTGFLSLAEDIETTTPAGELIFHRGGPGNSTSLPPC